MDDHEKKMFDTIKSVIDLAQKNMTTDQDIIIETAGSSPQARMRVPAYILRRLLDRG